MRAIERASSDPTAMKPANKAKQSAAESVERRAGTKGNADQQSTHRTQSRKRVTQALSRVRHELRRQTPKVGAGCSNWARPDPCGGCPAMGIPTAILAPQLPFDCRLADGLRSVGSCHSFPPLVGRCQDGPGSPTRLLATKRGWLRAVSSNLWVRVFLSRGCLLPRV